MTNKNDENSIEFWKEKYEELSIQFDDYQKHSLDLENELELQLRHSEDRIKDLQHRNNRLSIENDTVKNKFNEINSSTHRQISQLQEELAKSKAVKDEMQKYIRELEQKNDDLERTNRCAMFSLGEFESKLNDALERNAILESELDEKDELAETVQRLRDEARDLKQELAVRQQKSVQLQQQMSETSQTTPMETSISIIDQVSNTTVEAQPGIPPQPQTNLLNTILNDLNIEQQQLNTNNSNNNNNTTKLLNGDSTSNIKSNNQHINMNGSNHVNNNLNSHPVTPSLRISALNFVGDALRKVTSMESRLVATRNLMKESNRDRRSATISAVEASRNQSDTDDTDQSNSKNLVHTSTKLLKKSDQPMS